MFPAKCGFVPAGVASRVALRLAGICAVALLTANCTGNTQRYVTASSSGSDIDPKYGVRASKRLYNEGDVIPKGGGRRFSGKPYVVAGRTYVPRDDARGYVREGLASWYGAAFHGRVTANGEVFDRHSIAAASPTLPLPCYARVTNLENGNSMVVRVNDRGPYHENRVMDLSEEAARALEFHRKGTARVRVEYVGMASVAGSDDRKLLATLRGYEGQPGGRAPVMVADLGAHEPEFTAKPVPLAFKPPESRTDPSHKLAPVLLASAAPSRVPPALQPGSTVPAPAKAPPSVVAGLNPGAALARKQAAPLSLAPPPVRLTASADPETTNAIGSHHGRNALTGKALAASKAKPTLLAEAAKSVPAKSSLAKSEPAKLALAKSAPVKAVAAVAADPKKQALAKLAASAAAPAAKPAEKPRRARVAGM